MAKLHFRSYTTNQMVLFPQRIDENIAENDPVRIVSSIVDHLDMSSVNKLYNGMGRCPYHPRMMLKIIIYAYMNNIYSCRRIEQLLLRDIHFIWLAGYEKPDFITINRFRNRLKDEINNIFTQLVLVLAEKGFVSLDVEYVDGTKIESKANKYTFVWRKTVERNRARLIDKVKALLAQVDDCIAQDNTKTDETVEFTPSQLAEISAELNASLSDPQVEMDKEEKKKRRKLAKELKERSEKLAEYNQHLETLGDRNSYSKTDKDATFMHMKEDAMNEGLTKPGYNLQIATENQFITNFALFPNPTDTLTYIPFMESFRERYGHFASTEVADSGYGSEENYEFMELNGTAAYVKYNRFHIEHRPQYVPDPFRSENFYYNKKEDYCVCPMGQHMTRTGTSHKTSASGYVSNRATYTAQNCEGCPLRCLCFDASGDRRVIDRNHKLEAYRQKASELLTSEEGLRHRGKRCIEPEAVFGQIKYNMAYRRFRHIGVDKVKMDFAFFAIAFNIKKMVAKMTKGGLFSYLRAYLTNITPYKLFIRLFFVEKQKLVVHPHKNVQRVFFIYIGSFDTPSLAFASQTAHAQNVGVKANALSFAHSALGMGAEMSLGYHWSAELYGVISPWKRTEDKAKKYWAVQPEVRYWPCQAMVGHFFGVHVDGAQYNVGGAAPFFGLPKSVKDARYEGWLAGGGVTYGYQWVLGRHWNAEAAVSVGYEHLRYKKFESPEECAPQVGERCHNYWGPTKLSASIIYIF